MKNLFSAHASLASIQASLKNTFSDYIGLQFTEVGENTMTAKLMVDSRHLRPGGIVNGAVFLAIIETVGSVAGRCTLKSPDQNSVGIQVNANHLRTATIGDVLTAVARPAHIGRTTQLWDVSISNQQGKKVSSGRITLLVVDKSVVEKR